MAYFTNIKINGVQIIRPNDFSPQREDVYVAEIQTMTKKIADLIGWKYADMTLQWDALPEAQLHKLLEMSGECSIEFTDADGDIHTEKIIRTSAVTTATRADGPEGTSLWKDVNVNISFLDTHN